MSEPQIACLSLSLLPDADPVRDLIIIIIIIFTKLPHS
jgi:hypothetical protein